MPQRRGWTACGAAARVSSLTLLELLEKLTEALGPFTVSSLLALGKPSLSLQGRNLAGADSGYSHNHVPQMWNGDAEV